MIARIGDCLLPEPARIGRLTGYRLAFNMRSDDGQIYANIHASGSFVLGALYWCTPGIFEKLDPFEGGYSRQHLMVECDGHVIEATAYTSNRENLFAGGAPNSEYLQKILRGCREHNLPEAYVREIELLAQMNGIGDTATSTGGCR